MVAFLEESQHCCDTFGTKWAMAVKPTTKSLSLQKHVTHAG
jgi:hypothetical protein